jgi:hypothetical protein
MLDPHDTTRRRVRRLRWAQGARSTDKKLLVRLGPSVMRDAA